MSTFDIGAVQATRKLDHSQTAEKTARPAQEQILILAIAKGREGSACRDLIDKTLRA